MRGPTPIAGSGAVSTEWNPLGAEALPEACAEAGENCRATYLEEQGLDGCCAGLVCKANAAAIPVCQSGTADELAASAQCLDRRTPGFTIEQQLTSTVGEIPFDTVSDLVLTLDASAKVRTVRLGLDVAADTQCTLDLEAGPELDADGSLVVTTFTIDALGGGSLADPCPGFPPLGLTRIYSTHLPGHTLVGSVRFDGFSCEGRMPGASAEPCFAGSIEVHLGGTLDGGGPSNTLSFENATLRLSGHACSRQL